MAIIKPVQATINANNFHDKAYSFVVESVLSPEEKPGLVVVSTSAGYVLTTSLTDQPKREHTFKYSRQDDGSWASRATVTLVAIEQSPVSGAVVIRDSSAEPVILTVDVAAAAVERLQPPVLMISQSTLTFAETSPGKPSFQVITITRTYPVAPVTLTTDAPDYFQLASDNQPAFSPSLTLTPSSTGTYVHVRYLANRPGSHTGQLLIQGAYENRTVTLRGRTRGLLPVRLSPAKQPARLKRGAGLLALMIIGGLAYAGYSNRCHFFPGLCQEAAASQPVTHGSNPVPASINNNDFSKEGIANRVKTPGRVSRPAKPATRQVLSNGPTEPAVKQPVSNPANEQQNVATSRTVDRNVSVRRAPANRPVNPAPDERARRRTPPTEESELERELNGPTKNQLY